MSAARMFAILRRVIAGRVYKRTDHANGPHRIAAESNSFLKFNVGRPTSALPQPRFNTIC
jgi:hypothetical protein